MRITAPALRRPPMLRKRKNPGRPPWVSIRRHVQTRSGSLFTPQLALGAEPVVQLGTARAGDRDLVGALRDLIVAGLAAAALSLLRLSVARDRRVTDRGRVARFRGLRLACRGGH